VDELKIILRTAKCRVSFKKQKKNMNAKRNFPKNFDWQNGAP
jgi:hypothetical protein